MHMLRIVIDKSSEWGEELWIAAKAFDKVHHSVLFDSLVNCRVDPNVITALRKLYCDLTAHVVLWPGTESRSFGIERHVRQGIQFRLCSLI